MVVECARLDSTWALVDKVIRGYLEIKMLPGRHEYAGKAYNVRQDHR